MSKQYFNNFSSLASCFVYAKVFTIFIVVAFSIVANWQLRNLVYTCKIISHETFRIMTLSVDPLFLAVQQSTLTHVYSTYMQVWNDFYNLCCPRIMHKTFRRSFDCMEYFFSQYGTIWGDQFGLTLEHLSPWHVTVFTFSKVVGCIQGSAVCRRARAAPIYSMNLYMFWFMSWYSF